MTPPPQRPFYSVVVPLYNKADYIVRALESVAAQRYRDYEAIVVDDGSTDESAAMVENFLATHPDLPPMRLVRQSNQGVSAARNRGIAEANGTYVTFLDSDDWWEPEFLEALAGLIERYPGAGLYSTSYYLHKNGSSRVAPVGLDEGFMEGPVDYCRVYARTLCMPLHCDTVAVSRERLRELCGFNTRLTLGEDFDLWIRLALSSPVVYLNRPLATYCQDVAVEFRALGHLHPPERHFLWNLDFLAEEEARNADLKQLLDNMRTYSLLPYYLSTAYHKTALEQLKKVDWQRQPRWVRLRYKMPRLLLVACYWLKKLASLLKNLLRRKHY